MLCVRAWQLFQCGHRWQRESGGGSIVSNVYWRRQLRLAIRESGEAVFF